MAACGARCRVGGRPRRRRPTRPGRAGPTPARSAALRRRRVAAEVRETAARACRRRRRGAGVRWRTRRRRGRKVGARTAHRPRVGRALNIRRRLDDGGARVGVVLPSVPSVRLGKAAERRPPLHTAWRLCVISGNRVHRPGEHLWSEGRGRAFSRMNVVANLDCKKPRFAAFIGLENVGACVSCVGQINPGGGPSSAASGGDAGVMGFRERGGRAVGLGGESVAPQNRQGTRAQHES